MPNTLKDSDVEKGYQASLSWLALLDKENYSESWDQSSSLMKSTIENQSWNQILQQTRKNLGKVISRTIVDKRIAKNPKDLPPGNYLVMVYKTQFKNKASALELVTLFLENDQWRTVTYQSN